MDLGIKIMSIIYLILILILIAWALIDMISSRRSMISANKWFWLIILFPAMGPILYFQITKNHKTQKRKFNPPFPAR